MVEFDSVFEDSNYVYIILELCVNKVDDATGRHSVKWSRNGNV